MKKTFLALFTFGAILSATPVTVSFQTADYSKYVPVNNENAVVGPYTLSVNGADVLAMCMDDFRGVNVHGPWTATVTSAAGPDFSTTVLGETATLPSYGSYQPTVAQLYTMEAYLFSQILQPNADRSSIQLAAWSIMDPNTLNGVINAGNSTVESYLQSAYSAAINPGSNPNFNPANYVILSDVSNCNQEFMVGTPEPSTCMLLGSALSLAGLIRCVRRRQTPTPAATA